MMTPQLLDLTRAKEFASEDDLLRELVETFEESLSQEIEGIETALMQQDKTKIEHALHALKGFMPLFTNDAFSQVVSEAYLTCRTQEFSKSELSINSLVPNLKILLTEVREWLTPL